MGSPSQEKTDAPLPPHEPPSEPLQRPPKLETQDAPRDSGLSPLGVTDSPVRAREPGHEDRPNDKMLKAEKVLGLSTPKPSLRSSSAPSVQEPSPIDSLKVHRDELIMDTNKSSIVSKRSVEKLYYEGQPEFFRYFVSKFKRRSPLINRGYWLRMKAIEYAVARFLSERTAKKKIVINLGCGYDPLPFLFLGKQPQLCGGTTFVDVDYPALMQNKVGILEKTEQLRALLPKFTRTAYNVGLLASSDPYVAIGCDLADVNPLQNILQDHLQLGSDSVAILFVSEVSTAYMPKHASQAVFDWTATYDDVRFALLEQHLPDGTDHPFAATMLAHFEKLRTPLRAIGTMEQMKARFVAAGYPDAGTEIRSLWELWSDPTFLSAEERRRLDHVEPFDEWEEFALFGSHYFLLIAEKEPGKDYSYVPYRATRASFFAGSSRASIMTAPTLNGNPHGHSQETPQYHFGPADILQTHELLEPHNFRRYAAVIPPPADDAASDSVGLLGGLGTQERLDSCNTYSRYDAIQPITGPPLRSGLMCHAITRLGSTFNCVLTGGRTSPDKASAESWLRLDGKWRRVQDLPQGRYRHCAVPLVLPTEPKPAHTVLVFGGKTGDGQVLDEWLIWTGETGWQEIPVAGDKPPARFGATMVTDSREATSGVLVGGMTSAGRVLNDFWHWSLEPDMTLNCRNVTARAAAFLKADACILGRFGAQLVRSNRGILMVGGVTAGRMLTRQDEILNMKTLRPQPIQGSRPLFIGNAVTDVDGGLLVLGGGATCFSFGTTWNRSCVLNDAPPGSFDMEWRLQSTIEAGKPTPEQSTIYVESSSTAGAASASLKMPEAVRIQDIQISHGVNFPQYVDAARPVILRKCQIGPCTTTWTNSYLKEAVGADRKVAVHSSPSEKMDFQKKNFTYLTQEFGAFLDAVERGERVYLRALSKDAPNDKPTSLAEDFPGLANDFALPDELEYVVQHAHSSPLRISGPVHMWLHYDVLANVLCQVRGRKRLFLFPPHDVSRLGFDAGASSSSVDVFGPDAVRHHPALAHAHPHVALLEPGDILFLPPMWVHTAAPTQDMSVAVNVFFRNLPSHGYAAGRDVYGNRDLAAYERGRKDVARIVKGFETLPGDVAGFYLERLAMEMLEKAKLLSQSKGGANGGGGGGGGGGGAGGRGGQGLHERFAELS